MPAQAHPHYANVILIGMDGTHLSTISKRKAEWYLKRELADEIPPVAPYGRALKLKFVHKKSSTEYWDLVVNKNQCVMCGSPDGLTLHHIVPRIIRRYFPDEIKGHAREWCVLLCETCHVHVEVMSQPIYKKDFPNYVREDNDIDLSLSIIKASGNLYKIPEDRQAIMLAKSSYKTVDEVPPLTLTKKEIGMMRSQSHERAIKEWADAFVQEHGGIAGTHRYFLNLFLSFNLKFPPVWFDELKKQHA